jgi:hypothetical protein
VAGLQLANLFSFHKVNSERFVLISINRNLHNLLQILSLYCNWYSSDTAVIKSSTSLKVLVAQIHHDSYHTYHFVLTISNSELSSFGSQWHLSRRESSRDLPVDANGRNHRLPSRSLRIPLEWASFISGRRPGMLIIKLILFSSLNLEC